LKLKKAPAYEQGRAGHNECDTVYSHILKPLGYSSPKSIFTALGNIPCAFRHLVRCNKPTTSTLGMCISMCHSKPSSSMQSKADINEVTQFSAAFWILDNSSSVRTGRLSKELFHIIIYVWFRRSIKIGFGMFPKVTLMFILLQTFCKSLALYTYLPWVWLVKPGWNKASITWVLTASSTSPLILRLLAGDYVWTPSTTSNWWGWTGASLDMDSNRLFNQTEVCKDMIPVRIFSRAEANRDWNSAG